MLVNTCNVETTFVTKQSSYLLIAAEAAEDVIYSASLKQRKTGLGNHVVTQPFQIMHCEEFILRYHGIHNILLICWILLSENNKVFK